MIEFYIVTIIIAIIVIISFKLLLSKMESRYNKKLEKIFDNQKKWLEENLR